MSNVSSIYLKSYGEKSKKEQLLFITFLYRWILGDVISKLTIFQELNTICILV